MTEYKSSAREHLIAFKTKNAIECFVEENINGPTMKHKAYANLAFSEEHTKTVDELSVEGIITTLFLKRNTNYPECTRFEIDTLRYN